MENKTIRDRIFAEYNNFFDAEKKIANYILNNSSFPYSVINTE